MVQFTNLVGLLCVIGAVSGKEQQHQGEDDFAAFDANKDGYIDPQELRTYYKELSEQQLHEFWTGIDKRQRGYFDKQEYLEFALSQGDDDGEEVEV